jgi:hypothetical protein
MYGQGFIDDVDEKVKTVSKKLDVYVGIMVFAILAIIVVVIICEYRKAKVTQENFSKLVNRQMVLRGVGVKSSYDRAPRSDRNDSTFWATLTDTSIDRTGHVLNLFSTQYKKKVGGEICESINQRVAKYLGQKDVTEVIDKASNSIEDVVITEKGSDVIDTKVEVIPVQPATPAETPKVEVVAKETILDDVTHEKIADKGEKIALIDLGRVEEESGAAGIEGSVISNAKPVSESVAESVAAAVAPTVATPTPAVVPAAPVEETKVAVPESITAQDKIEPTAQEQTVGLEEAMINAKEEPTATAPLSTGLESFQHARGMSTKQFEGLQWEIHPKITETTKPVVVSEAFFGKKMSKK